MNLMRKGKKEKRKKNLPIIGEFFMDFYGIIKIGFDRDVVFFLL